MFEDYDDDYKSHEEIEKMPIYQKAYEIMQLGRKIGALVSKEDVETADEAEGEMLENYAMYIIENSLMIPAKIAGAEGADIYDIRPWRTFSLNAYLFLVIAYVIVNSPKRKFSSTL